MGVYLKGQKMEPSLWDDTSTSGVIYLGFVAPNSNADDLIQCVIERVNTNTGQRSFVDGDDLNFVYKWDKRLTYTYNIKNSF